MKLNFDQYIETSREGLALQTQAHKAWGFGTEDNWAVDLDKGTLELTWKTGKIASTSIQVVGSFNSYDGTFLWGFDHPSVPEPLRDHAKIAHEWGITNDVEWLVSRKLECSQDAAWSLAAVTNRLAQANGVYSGATGTARIFLTLGEWKVVVGSEDQITD